MRGILFLGHCVFFYDGDCFWAGLRLYSAGRGRAGAEDGAYASWKARAQLHDGQPINEEGQADDHVSAVYLSIDEIELFTVTLRNKSPRIA